MHTVLTWLIANSTGLICGFLIGWLCFKRPDLLERFFSWVKSRIFKMGGS